MPLRERRQDLEPKVQLGHEKRAVPFENATLTAQWPGSRRGERNTPLLAAVYWLLDERKRIIKKADREHFSSDGFLIIV